MKRWPTTKLSTILTGCIVGIAIVTLWAQEPRQENRGILVTQGNLVVSRGYVYGGGNIVRDYRTASAITTTSAATYTAAQVLSGWIQRTPTLANVTDVLPTAANLAAAIPNVAAGHSFWILVDMGATPNASVTLNGASTGVTYAGGCATAIGTLDAMPILISFTSATAYTATCVNVNT